MQRRKITIRTPFHILIGTTSTGPLIIWALFSSDWVPPPLPLPPPQAAWCQLTLPQVFSFLSQWNWRSALRRSRRRKCKSIPLFFFKWAAFFSGPGVPPLRPALLFFFLSVASSTRRLLQYASQRWQQSQTEEKWTSASCLLAGLFICIVVLEIGLCPPFKGVVLVSDWILDQDTFMTWKKSNCCRLWHPEWHAHLVRVFKIIKQLFLWFKIVFNAVKCEGKLSLNKTNNKI